MHARLVLASLLFVAFAATLLSSSGCVTGGRVGELFCDNGLDDDNDGATDCADSDCTSTPECGGSENCFNGFDDDGDGAVDCADSDCAGDPACGGGEDCFNGIDDDGDGAVDCADSDCAMVAACVGGEICNNATDDDGDGAVDCMDTDCAADPFCVGEDCANGIDDDGDGATDCADADCLGDPACTGSEDCTNGVDDDGDGFVDCADVQCVGNPACVAVEDCTNGVDDDGDGVADCLDVDCFADPLCGPGSAVPIASAGGSIMLTGSIDATDPTWMRASAACSAGSTAGYHYDEFRIVNMTGAARTLTITANWSGDGYLHLWNDPFNPTVITGCIVGDDDFGTTLASQITGQTILPGQVLVIVASTFSAGSTIGAYTIVVDSL